MSMWEVNPAPAPNIIIGESSKIFIPQFGDKARFQTGNPAVDLCRLFAQQKGHLPQASIRLQQDDIEQHRLHQKGGFVQDPFRVPVYGAQKFNYIGIPIIIIIRGPLIRGHHVPILPLVSGLPLHGEPIQCVIPPG